MDYKPVEDELLDRVYASYGRCSLSKEFYKDFYDKLMSKSPKIAEKFRFTDMKAQQEAVKHGLGFLILFAKGHHAALRKIKELGESHSRENYNISPEYYQYWADSLIACVEKHDAKSEPKLLEEWRLIITKGINGIKQGY